MKGAQLVMPGIPASVDPDAEFFATPLELAAVCASTAINLYRIIHRRWPARVLEPSAGDGAFVRPFERMPGVDVDAIDIRDTEAACLRAGARKFWQGDIRQLAECAGRYDLVLGNPPFSQAAEHVEALLKHARKGTLVAFLLRLNFLCGECRKGFWEEHPLFGLVPIRQRPRFVGGGSDNSDYGLFVWVKRPGPGEFLGAQLYAAIDW